MLLQLEPWDLLHTLLKVSSPSGVYFDRPKMCCEALLAFAQRSTGQLAPPLSLVLAAATADTSVMAGTNNSPARAVLLCAGSGGGSLPASFGDLGSEAAPQVAAAAREAEAQQAALLAQRVALRQREDGTGSGEPLTLEVFSLVMR